MGTLIFIFAHSIFKDISDTMITEKSKEDTGVKQKLRKSRLQNGEYEYGKVQI